MTDMWHREGAKAPLGGPTLCKKPSPWKRILEKLTVAAQLVNKLPVFMEPEGSLPFSQELATGPLF
jgi:hypothetical protein